ncbi:MAG: hypothetical protein ACRDHG_06595, partial [Anaerolineales bacterium]
MATDPAIQFSQGINPKDLETLELPKVLARLASYGAFSASKQLALELSPTAALETARVRQQQTSQARQLLSARPALSIGGARDVRPQVRAAERGAVLEPQDLLDVKATLESSRT